MRGISSAGRAPALHAGGQRFDPVILHQLVKVERVKKFSECFLILSFLTNEFSNKYCSLKINE